VRAYKRNNKERFARIHDIFERVGSAVLMAAFTTFLAGFSMYPSGLVSFCKMGQFLMLVMCLSYIYATFFFVPLCALFGPTKNFGNMQLKKVFLYAWYACTFCFRSKNPNPNEPNHSGDDNKAVMIMTDGTKDIFNNGKSDRKEDNGAKLLG
jgi:predicted RND superfamily exporter protein